MHISAIEEYSLRCALQLAALAPDTQVSASQIAEREGISVQYASKIMHLFRKAGLVTATRGIQGGFRLSVSPKEIPLTAVFAAARGEEEEKGKSFCTQYKGLQKECVHLKDCSVRPVWQVLSEYFDGVLAQLTLQDLQLTEASTRERLVKHAQGEVEKIRQRFGISEASSSMSAPAGKE
jgi:Rrf2 family protein